MNTPSWINKIHNPKLPHPIKYPIFAPVFTGHEKQYVTKCIDESWISPKGDFVTRLEKSFARYCGAQYAIACSSGTSALRLCLIALDVGPGDEVIVPTLTMISTALAVSYLGATPVFVDSDRSTGNMNIDHMARAITKKTKAIIPVHLYGNPIDIDLVQDIAKRSGVYVIEDAAEAIGAQIHNKRIGSQSILTAFSMYANKIVTAGQGGMITTTSKKLYQSIKKYNNYYFSNVRHFWHERIGYNFKLSSLQAAVALAQLEHIETSLEKKRQIAAWYNECLKPVSHLCQPLGKTKDAKSNEWMVAFVFPTINDLQPLRDYLATQSIETRTFFIPLHLQPAYRALSGNRELPVSEFLAQHGMLLPSGTGLAKNDVAFISEKICTYLTS